MSYNEQRYSEDSHIIHCTVSRLFVCFTIFHFIVWQRYAPSTLWKKTRLYWQDKDNVDNKVEAMEK